MRVGGRRLLAVLAGGVVLAGGGVTTLAAWQDETWDKAPLSLTRFNVQQTLDPAGADGSFVEAEDSGSAAGLQLKVGALSNVLLSPGVATTGWVGLRVDAGSVGGTVRMDGATITGDVGALAPQLTYQAVAGVSEATCRSGSLPVTAPAVVLATDGSALTSSSGSTFHLEAGATPATAGQMVGVCIKITLKSGTARSFSGSSVSPTWRFSATSDS